MRRRLFRTAAERRLDIRWHDLGNGRQIRSWRNPCHEPDHQPCWLCRSGRAFEAMNDAQRAEYLASIRADRAAERAADAAAIAAGRRPRQPPRAVVRSVDW